MSTVAIVYATREGQTARIAEHVADRVFAAGHAPTVMRVDEPSAPSAVAEADAVVVGASIHVGKHEPEMARFVETRAEELGAAPSAFFSVSLSMHDGEPGHEGRAQAEAYVEQFFRGTAWRPDLIGLFAGALRYSQYGFVKRALLKRIARAEGLPEDTSRDYELTDWDSVDHFVEDFLRLLEP